MYKYIYEPRALLEYLEALTWYKERSISAAQNFETEINERLAAICLQPNSFRNTKKYFRETLLKKYPYSVIYFVDEVTGLIVIISIFHQRRNPKSKFKGY